MLGCPSQQLAPCSGPSHYVVRYRYLVCFNLFLTNQSQKPPSHFCCLSPNAVQFIDTQPAAGVLKIYICILKQAALCTEFLESSNWRLCAWSCTGRGSWKREEDPAGCLLSLPDPIEDLLGAHASFWACHLSHWGAAGTGWEQTVLVPMALHKKAFTNNEALKHPQQKCQQLELGSVVLWREAGWAGGAGKRPPLLLPGWGKGPPKQWRAILLPLTAPEKARLWQGSLTLLQIRVCTPGLLQASPRYPKKHAPSQRAWLSEAAVGNQTLPTPQQFTQPPDCLWCPEQTWTSCHLALCLSFHFFITE